MGCSQSNPQAVGKNAPPGKKKPDKPEATEKKAAAELKVNTVKQNRSSSDENNLANDCCGMKSTCCICDIVSKFINTLKLLYKNSLLIFCTTPHPYIYLKTIMKY